MKQKAIIFGTFEPWLERFKQSSAAHDLEYVHIDPATAVFGLEDRRFTVNGAELLADSRLIVVLEEDYEAIYYSLALAKDAATAMLNGDSVHAFPNFSNKFYQYQLLQKFSERRFAATYFSITPALLMDKITPHETLAKVLNSSRGRGVFKLSGKSEIVQLADEIKERMFVQKFIETDPVHDYRTILVGGKSVGTIKRTATSGFKVSGTTDVVKTSEPSFIGGFESLARKLKLDLCGFDYFIEDERPIISEINRFPHFSGFAFDEPVGIDTAGLLVAHLLEKRA